MTSTTTMTTEEIAQGWLAGLQDVDAFLPLCAPECKVWHSNDDKWVTVPEAIAAVHEAGGLPPMRDMSYTLMDGGFLVQFSATWNGAEIHNVILVKVRDGLAVSAEEYVGLEMSLTA
jgi:hypothetical protein